jgi:type VI secretion system Hcp family effector
MMAARPVVGYMKVPGIPGSAIKKGFEQQIAVHGYEHAIVRSMAQMHDSTYVPERLLGAVGVPLGSSREAHRPFIVIKGMDRATVLLLQSLNNHVVFKEPIELAIIQSVQTGELVAMKIVLKQAVVQGMEYSEVGGEGTVERVSFAYSEIEWTYEGLDEAGKKTGSLMTAANLERK